MVHLFPSDCPCQTQTTVREPFLLGSIPPLMLHLLPHLPCVCNRAHPLREKTPLGPSLSEPPRCSRTNLHQEFSREMQNVSIGHVNDCNVAHRHRTCPRPWPVCERRARGARAPGGPGGRSSRPCCRKRAERPPRRTKERSRSCASCTIPTVPRARKK